MLSPNELRSDDIKNDVAASAISTVVHNNNMTKLIFSLSGMVWFFILGSVFYSMTYQHHRFDSFYNPEVCGYGVRSNNTCVCYENYGKYQSETCNYKLLSKRSAIILEVFFGFTGAQSYYTGNLYFGIFRTVWFICTVLLTVCTMCTICKNNSNKHRLLPARYIIIISNLLILGTWIYYIASVCITNEDYQKMPLTK